MKIRSTYSHEFKIVTADWVLKQGYHYHLKNREKAVQIHKDKPYGGSRYY
jgi:hypothetical protein